MAYWEVKRAILAYFLFSGAIKLFPKQYNTPK
jgi:hypothetical protein